MIDQTTLAYVNLYAVLGALADLTSLDPRAQALLKGKKPTRLGIAVKGGPAATLVFEEQRCRLEEGVGPVSYTHLDVYKRQPLPPAASNAPSTG